MSQILTATDATLRFQHVYDKALEEYKKTTKKDLTSHALFSRLNTCDSADAILAVLRSQIREFGQSTNSNDRLTKWLDPVVHVLYTFSATIGASVGGVYPPANAVFTGIAILLSSVKAVRTSHGILADLFERIENFIQRLEAYVEVPEIAPLTDIITKVMAEVLSILAIATNEIERGVAKTFLNKLVGRTDIEDALRRLDKLTQDEIRMVAAQSLKAAHGIDDRMVGMSSEVQAVGDKVEGVQEKLRVVGEQMHRVLNSGEETRLTIQQMTNDVCDLSRDQLRQKVKEWLSPPDPSVNFNTASESQHEGTGLWFTQGSMFTEWKQSGSLLWIHGNPGSGKSVLCSAIIKDLKSVPNKAPIAYFFFDFKDARKQDVRALLSSLLIQICGQSAQCCDILRGLYSRHDKGSHQPSVGALIQCLEDMVKIAENVPIYLVVDTVDECPDRGMPSSRGKVLELLKHLVEKDLQNLRLCISSRPEIDIRTVLNPLTSTCISLHKQGGQSKDIIDYIISVVHSDGKMKNWRDEDRELVIKSLSDRAGGMFRWVYCQVESLRRCLARNVRSTLEALPSTLDDTYMRILQEIPEENRDDAHRLLQCLTVAIRPLRVAELAEVLAIDFPERGIPKLREDWRWEDEEQAVFLACSSLISIVDDWDRRVVQFSHFSVKEFLTSDRLAALPAASSFHILPEPAHTVMAQACLGILIRLGHDINLEDIKNFPLANYAADWWSEHVEFENVTSQIGDVLDYFLDADKPHFSTSLRIESASCLDTLPDPLYYFAQDGHLALAQFIISKRPEAIVFSYGEFGTPLHAASANGQFKVAQLLLDHCVDVDIRNHHGETSLHLASNFLEYDICLLLLEHGADADSVDHEGTTPLDSVIYSENENSEYEWLDITVTRFLLERGLGMTGLLDRDPFVLHFAAFSKNPQLARLLLEYGADLHMPNMEGQTPLHVAADSGCLASIQLFLEYGASVDAQDSNCATPLDIALRNEWCDTARLLLQWGANVDVRTNGQTPLHRASQGGYCEIMELLLEHGADVMARDNEHSTPLHLAAFEGRVSATWLLLEHGSKVHVQNNKGETPFQVASARGHSEVAQMLVDHVHTTIKDCTVVE